MYSFNYLKPVSIEDAASMLSESDEHKVIAGGMTLIPTLKQRLARVEHLIGLEKCGLNEIKLDGELLKIGAMATHAEVSESDIVVMVNPADNA